MKNLSSILRFLRAKVQIVRVAKFWTSLDKLGDLISQKVQIFDEGCCFFFGKNAMY